MNENAKRSGIIILAAGSSSRLGRPKQLIKKDGQSLVRRMAELALSQPSHDEVVVVTGAYAAEVSDDLHGLPVSIIINRAWQEGIASSIRTGIKELASRGLDAALVLLCDQAEVTGQLIEQLTEAWLTGMYKVVYSVYGGQPGVPALFDKNLFPDLLALHGDRGAKQVIALHANDGKAIDFPGGVIDIDTVEDLNNLGM